MAIWLFRSKSFNITEDLVDLKNLFVRQFNITQEEVAALFLDDTQEFREIFDLASL